MSKFLSIHNHSRQGSLRDGLSDIHELVKISKERDMAFAITEHGSVGSWVQYNIACKKHGVKPVFGNEIYINRKRDRMFEVRAQLKRLKEMNKNSLSKEEKANLTHEVRQLSLEFDEIKKPRHLVVIAKNQHGLHNLLELSNVAYLKGFYNKPTNCYEEIFDLPKDKNGDRGIIVTSACLASDSSQYILAGKNGDAEDWAQLMREELRENFFLEVQVNEMEEQDRVNKQIFRIHEKTKIPLVIGTDSHYVDKSFSRAHEIFLLLQGGQKVSDSGKKVWRITYENEKGELNRKKYDLDKDFFGSDIETLKAGDVVKKKTIRKIEKIDKVWMIESCDLSFKDEASMIEKIKTDPFLAPMADTLIDNSKKIYDMVEEMYIDSAPKMPKFEDAEERLKLLVARGLKKRGKATDKAYIDRCKEELRIMEAGDYCSYFIILHDIVELAKKLGLPVGPGRGSGVGSLVCWALGIHECDSIYWDFPFERFLSAERADSGIRIKIATEDGRTLEFKENEMVSVTRTGEKKRIRAKNILETDELDLPPEEVVQ